MGKTPKQVLSLGCGVQSTTVALMSRDGVLPKLDAAVFADTQAEPSSVYEHFRWLRGELEKAGIPVHVGTAGDLGAQVLKGAVAGEGRFASIPVHVKQRDGSRGMVPRQCTRDFKVRVIERVVREKVLGLRPRQRAPLGAVEQWMGISIEEKKRARMSTKGWVAFRYPLLFDVPMRRAECIKWLLGRGYPLPSKSACYFCPYRSPSEWRALRERDPEDFKRAVAFDEKIRNQVGLDGEAYLHGGLVSLGEADLRTDQERGQEEFWSQECMGMCGV